MQHETSLPLVSIIIPCFNHQALLSKALSSCLSQTYTNIEIIVIDDGSQIPISIPSEYLEHSDKIRLIRTPNQGVAEARNYGISLSKGQYLKFLDADDELMPKCVEKQVQVLSTSKRQICFIGFKVVSGHKSTAGVGKFDNFLSACLMGNIAPLHSGLFDSQVVKAVEGFDCPSSKISLVEDHYFHLKLSLLGVIPITLHDIGVIYHKQPASRSSIGKELYLARLDLIEIVLSNHQSILKNDLDLVISCLMGLINNTTQFRLFESAMRLLPFFQPYTLSKCSHRILLELSILSRSKLALSVDNDERQFWDVLVNICPDHRHTSSQTLIPPTYALNTYQTALTLHAVDGELLALAIQKALASDGIWLWGISPLTDTWISMARAVGIKIIGIIDSYRTDNEYQQIKIHQSDDVVLSNKHKLLICSQENYFDIRVAAEKLGLQENIIDYLIRT